MRILIILKYIPSASGRRPNKADAMFSTIESLKAAGHDVVLFSTGWEEPHPYESIPLSHGVVARTSLFVTQLLCRLSLLPKERVRLKLQRNMVNAIGKYHGNHPIDLVLAYGTSEQPILLAHELKQEFGIAYVFREHRTFYQRTFRSRDDIPGPELAAIEAADKVCAVSEPLARNMARIGLDIPVTVLPNSISDEFFDPPAATGPFRQWAGERFMFAGWTNWRKFKRLDLLVDAFSLVREKHSDVCLVVAGDIDDLDTIKNKISALNLDKDVLLFGRTDRVGIHQLAHSCDCCVIPSDVETFGLPAIEANAAGKPVVCTESGGPESIITSEALGRVVPIDDAGLLAKAMADAREHHLLFDPDYIRRHLFDSYSRTAVSKMWAEVIANLHKKGGDSRGSFHP